MTEKQKQAIRILNTLKGKFEIDDDEYFLILDFVVGTHDQCPQVEVEPWVNEPALLTKNYEPYGRFGGVTCEPAMQGGSAMSGIINSELEVKK